MPEPLRIEPVTLEGAHVRLEPLTMEHHQALCEVGLDEDLVHWTESYTLSPAGVRTYIETALRLQAQGVALPFAVIGKATGRPVGSTRYGNIDTTHRRVEIGWKLCSASVRRRRVSSASTWSCPADACAIRSTSASSMWSGHE